MKKIINFLGIIFVYLFGVTFSLAQGQVNTEDTGGTLQGGGSFTLENPIRAENFAQFLNDILSIVVQIGVPVVVVGIIYAGFLFVTAGGNTEKLTNAKRTFLGVLIGAGIVLGAFVISEAIQGTVNQLGG